MDPLQRAQPGVPLVPPSKRTFRGVTHPAMRSGNATPWEPQAQSMAPSAADLGVDPKMLEAAMAGGPIAIRPGGAQKGFVVPPAAQLGSDPAAQAKLMQALGLKPSPSQVEKAAPPSGDRWDYGPIVPPGMSPTGMAPAGDPEMQRRFRTVTDEELRQMDPASLVKRYQETRDDRILQALVEILQGGA